MKKLGATKEMFELRVNNRSFAEFYMKNIVNLSGEITEKGTQLYDVTKAIDSKPKITEEEFLKELKKAKLNKQQIEQLQKYLEADLEFVKQYEEKSSGAKDLLGFFKLMTETGYGEFIRYNPEIIRGLDYYTGMVVEQFDLNPENNRAMYGGGRYDNLIQLFSEEKIGGVGFAMGDMTLLEFLEGWNLLPNTEQEIDFLVTLWPSEAKSQEYLSNTLKVARKIREKGKKVINWIQPGTSISDQLSYANKENIKKVVIQGERELEKGTISVKDMATEKQKEVKLEKFLKDL
jgi:histidyl-tRNA synthetase